MPPSKFDNASAFAASAVHDMLQAITTTAKETRLRLTSEFSPSRLIWIMIDRLPATSANAEEQVWAHINDGDLSIGTPMSLSVCVPLSNATTLASTITNYLDGELVSYGKVDALMQSVNLDGTHNPHVIGDSESGYGNWSAQATNIVV